MVEKPSYEDLQRRIRQLERFEVDLKRTQTALDASRQRFRMLFNEARDMILIHGYTPDGVPDTFAEVNDITCSRMGYTREELLTLSVSDILIEEEVEDIPVTSSRLRGQTGLIFEKTFKTKSGELIPVEINSRMFNDQEKKFTISIARDITQRKARELERERLIDELETALANIKKLSGLLPICSQCKKIRDDKGYWQQLEEYIQDHSEAEFTHGICRECTRKLYPDFEIPDDEKN